MMKKQQLLCIYNQVQCTCLKTGVKLLKKPIKYPSVMSHISTKQYPISQIVCLVKVSISL